MAGSLHHVSFAAHPRYLHGHVGWQGQIEERARGARCQVPRYAGPYSSDGGMRTRTSRNGTNSGQIAQKCTSEGACADLCLAAYSDNYRCKHLRSGQGSAGRAGSGLQDRRMQAGRTRAGTQCHTCSRYSGYAGLQEAPRLRDGRCDVRAASVQRPVDHWLGAVLQFGISCRKPTSFMRVTESRMVVRRGCIGRRDHCVGVGSDLHGSQPVMLCAFMSLAQPDRRVPAHIIQLQ